MIEKETNPYIVIPHHNAVIPAFEKGQEEERKSGHARCG
jgi:hypothetical protein